MSNVGNLGMYQLVTTWMKKFGGPKNFLSAVAGAGIVIGGTAVKGYQMIKKHFTDAIKQKHLEAAAAIVHTVNTEGVSNEGLMFHVGDQFKVLELDGDAALIEKIGDSHNPYFVSAKFLATISDYSPD